MEGDGGVEPLMRRIKSPMVDRPTVEASSPLIGAGRRNRTPEYRFWRATDNHYRTDKLEGDLGFEPIGERLRASCKPSHAFA